MPRWRMNHQTIEVNGVLHRPECPTLAAPSALDADERDRLHEAGDEIKRDRAPVRCSRCYPDYDLLLGG